MKTGELEGELQDFAHYLKDTKQTPFTCYFHYPVDNPGQFHQDLAAAPTLELFFQQYLSATRKGILKSAWVLGVSSLLWQAVANFSDPDDLLVFSINTGLGAAAGVIIANCVLMERSLTAYLVSATARLLPVWLADGLWKTISISTKNPWQHLAYFIGAGGLFTVTQTLVSKGVKSTLSCCEVSEQVKSYVPSVTWSTPVSLGVSYFGFRYLIGPLGFLTILPAAAFSSAIPAILRGVVVDLAIAHRNVAALKSLYDQYVIGEGRGEYEAGNLNSSYSRLTDESESPPEEKGSTCKTFTRCLSAPFRYCYLLFCSPSNKSQSSERQIESEGATIAA